MLASEYWKISMENIQPYETWKLFISYPENRLQNFIIIYSKVFIEDIALSTCEVLAQIEVLLLEDFGF